MSTADTTPQDKAKTPLCSDGAQEEGVCSECKGLHSISDTVWNVTFCVWWCRKCVGEHKPRSLT